MVSGRLKLVSFLLLVFLRPSHSTEGQLRGDAKSRQHSNDGAIITRGDARSQQQSTDDGLDTDAERRHLWGSRGSRTRDNVRVENSRRRRPSRSSQSRYIPKYGRRYDTISESLDGFTAADHYQQPSSQHQDNYLNDYYGYNDYYEDYDYESSSSKSSAYRKIPCFRRSKRLKKNRSGHRQKYHHVKSKSKSKGKSKASSRSKSRGKSRSKAKGRTSFDACDEEDEDDGMETIICSATIKDFQSSVAVIFNGDPQFLTAPEQIALETSFQDTYNTLTFGNCDGYFRRIESVSLFIPGERRRLEEDSSSSDSSDEGDYDVAGTCRDCPVSTSGSFELFDDSFRRRKLQYTSIARNGDGPFTERMPSDTDVCTCPDQGAGRNLQLQQQNLEPNAPSEEDFLIAYNEDIERLVEEGIVTNIDSIGALEETPIEEEVPVLCSPNIADFMTYVLVEFDGDATALSAMESSILGILLEQVYNELTFNNCDGFFRMTDDTTFFPEQGVNPSFFQVGATCRDCPVNSDGTFSIFNNLQRLLSRLEWLNQAGRSFGFGEKANQRIRRAQEEMNGDVCFCLALSDNLEDLDPAAPTANAVQQLLNQRIAELRSTGIITNIFSITSLSESSEVPVLTEPDETTPSPSAAEAQLDTTAPTTAEVPPETAAPTVAAQPDTTAPTVAEAPPDTIAPTMAEVPPETAAPTLADTTADTIAPTMAEIPPETATPTLADTTAGTAMPTMMGPPMKTMQPSLPDPPPMKTMPPTLMMSPPPKMTGEATTLAPTFTPSMVARRAPNNSSGQKAEGVGTGQIKGARTAGQGSVADPSHSGSPALDSREEPPTWSPTRTPLPTINRYHEGANPSDTTSSSSSSDSHEVPPTWSPTRTPLPTITRFPETSHPTTKPPTTSPTSSPPAPGRRRKRPIRRPGQNR